MSHKYRILERMLNEGKISQQEFKDKISAEYGKLEQELMNDEITPDEYVQKYNELIREKAEQHWEPVGPHEHI